MFAVIFICWNLFLQIARKTAKIRTLKTFVPHGILKSYARYPGFYRFRALDSDKFLLEH